MMERYGAFHSATIDVLDQAVRQEMQKAISQQKEQLAHSDQDLQTARESTSYYRALKTTFKQGQLTMSASQRHDLEHRIRRAKLCAEEAQRGVQSAIVVYANSDSLLGYINCMRELHKRYTGDSFNTNQLRYLHQFGYGSGYDYRQLMLLYHWSEGGEEQYLRFVDSQRSTIHVGLTSRQLERELVESGRDCAVGAVLQPNTRLLFVVLRGEMIAKLSVTLLDAKSWMNGAPSLQDLCIPDHLLEFFWYDSSL
eukprot:TRINITY_DN2068_c0_g1_i1.p1 TRINITY_DN2068_c0_g1~~TRINITY_DN2068_c0_g1_i1.p1  ORF type:complete len:253 (+),score=23.38 TRINITY_DN2068_c0_g1_i1:126-884(+)